MSEDGVTAKQQRIDPDTDPGSQLQITHAQLTMRLLGPLEARDPVARRALNFPNAKTRALLAILASERGRVFSQDELLERLWPEELAAGRTMPERARANLRNRIAELRRVHPSLARQIATRARAEPGLGGYLLERSPEIWVDLEELARLCARGRTLAERNQFAEAIPLLEEAARLYRGDFLAEERYVEWAVELRELWRERHLACLSCLADCCARLGKYRQAIERCRQILQLRPYHEESWQALMRYCYHSGQLADALAAYEECRRALAPLEVEPSPQTQQLAEQIRRRALDKIERLPEPELVHPLPYSLGQMPFVGRDQELSILRDCWREAQVGQGSCLLISGEAGIGKSRLIEVFLHELRARDVGESAQATARCLDLALKLAFVSLIALVRGLPEGDIRKAFAQLAPVWQVELSRLIPELQESPSASPLPAEPDGERLRRLEAFTQLFTRLAEQRPLCLALDDWQWIDPDSLDFFKYFVPRLGRLPLLIVGAYRSEEIEAPLEPLRAESGRPIVRYLQLSKLSAEQVKALLEGFSPEAEMTEWLHRKTGGLPLYLLSCLRHLFEEGHLRLDGRGALKAETDLSTLTSGGLCPDDLREVLRRRLSRLPEECREVLTAAAVLGDPVERGLLEATWQQGRGERPFAPTEAFEEALRGLERTSLFELRGQAYGFSHDLIRDVVYADLSPQQRQRWHQAAAEAIEGADANRQPHWPALAHHHARGGRPRKALSYTFWALREMERRGQSSPGAALGELGLDLCRELEARGDAPRRRWMVRPQARLLAWLALFYDELGDRQREEECLRQLLRSEELKGAIHDSPLRLLALERWVIFLGAVDRYEEADVAIEEGLRLARRLRRSASEAFFHDALGRLSWFRGDEPRAEREMLLAYRLLRRSSRPRETQNAMHALAHLATQAYHRGDHERALAWFGRIRRLNRALRDPSWEANLCVRPGTVFYFLGAYEQARACLEEGRRRYHDLGQRLWEANAAIMLGLVYRDLGWLGEAERVLQEGLQLAREVQERMAKGLALSRLGSVLIRQGRARRALQLLEEGAQMIEAIGDRVHEPEVWAALAEGHLANGDLERAEAVSRRAVEHLETKSGWLFETAALHIRWRVLKAKGASEEARRCLEQAYERIQALAQGLHKPEFRESFLKIPIHSELIAAYEGNSSTQTTLLFDEARCYLWLREARWPQGVRCPYCQGMKVQVHGRLPKIPEKRYLCPSCQKTFSDRTGTAFAHRNLPLERLCRALKLVSESRSIESRELAEILKVDPKTAATLHKRLSAALQTESWIQELARRLG